jgi:ABC-2 type transport system permease protein
MASLFFKEISSFFHSLTGYIVIIIFLLLNGLLLWVFDTDMNILNGGYATLDSLFLLAPWVFLMLIPAITMRSLAEERRTGTLDLLRTRPMTEFQIILAKYGAAVVLIVLALLPTLVYYFTVVSLGNPVGNLDKGGTWGSYTGLLFLAGAYAAIGLFCSSLTDNLIVAFLMASILCLALFQGFEQAGILLSGSAAGSYIVSLGISEHYSSMSRGVLDSRDVVYFLALISIFLVLTVYRLQTEKR